MGTSDTSNLELFFSVLLFNHACTIFKQMYGGCCLKRTSCKGVGKLLFAVYLEYYTPDLETCEHIDS